jgi:two-component system phosphate regulon response regulator OmpR
MNSNHKIPSHILVVDDDRRLRQLLHHYLEENGYLVTQAADSLEAQHLLKLFIFDSIILDVMMPGEDGISLTQRLRQVQDVPILLLTAMAETNDRIRGLEAGADDYMIKPFDPRELLLRLKSIIRRSQFYTHTEKRYYYFGDYSFDRERLELLEKDKPIHLTTLEQTILDALIARGGTIVSRETLAQLTGMAGNLRTIDVQITRLRRKFEKDARQPQYLQTMRGSGYIFRSE